MSYKLFSNVGALLAALVYVFSFYILTAGIYNPIAELFRSSTSYTNVWILGGMLMFSYIFSLISSIQIKRAVRDGYIIDDKKYYLTLNMVCRIAVIALPFLIAALAAL